MTAAKDKTADLKAALDELKTVQITPILSDEATDAIVKQMQDLKVKLGQVFVLDHLDSAQIDYLLGITINAADVSTPVNVQRSGPLEDNT